MLSIGRMIHAPSCTTSSECLHFLPSRLHVPFLSLTLVSHSRRGFLRRSRFPPSFLFLLDEFNSYRRSADALSIFPDFCRHRVAFAYRFRCADTPESIRSPSFNTTRPPPRRFLSVASGCVPACDLNRGWRTHRRINLFRPTVLQPEVENYRRNTKTETTSKTDLKSINSSPFKPLLIL